MWKLSKNNTWNLQTEFSEINTSPFLAAKKRFDSHNVTTCIFFKKQSSWKTAWVVSDWSDKSAWKTSPEKDSYFRWNIPAKSSKHRNFTRQIAFSRTTWFLFCPIFWAQSSCAPIKSILKSYWSSQKVDSKTCKLHFQNIFPPFFAENTAIYSWTQFDMIPILSLTRSLQKRAAKFPLWRVMKKKLPDWQVRGMYRCLWYARGLCLCPRVITPRGFTSKQEAEYSFSGLILKNKQTTKQTTHNDNSNNNASLSYWSVLAPDSLPHTGSCLVAFDGVALSNPQGTAITLHMWR